MLNDFLSLIFPNYCLACNRGLAKGEELLCLKCEYSLPQTKSHLEPDNFIAHKFYGRVPLAHVFANYKFNKSGKVQRLLHRLKYDNKPELGVLLGKKYGVELAKDGFQDKFDIIVPVPLHAKRLRRRGYNQSEMFADGLSEALGVPREADALIRRRNTFTQTKKSRLSRWKNVSEIFQLNDSISIEDKHILLVDDVITTGATIEACVHPLIDGGSKSVSVAAIAAAK
ncbi:ComF family protein [Fulvivirga ligni]|uniref:ComF family protein n=1 Tax=Fulvivirga ligni TaxID=2904246 RepID=UPI001F2B5A54|nr:ComF family protein [Fulvivirga ligni]UII22347.1 ComF family protein [Fulvivirga ligni]